MLNELKNKKILILGLGREGLSTYQLLRQLFPTIFLTLADELPSEKLNSQFQKIIKADTKIIQKLGPDYLDNLDTYNIIIKTPGIPLKGSLLTKKISDKITSQVKLFFANCTGKIVGITGTKGKSTTASLIYHILNFSGLPAKLAGNIGNPVLPLLQTQKKEDIFVLELSSHQLADLQQSPHVAVLLNIYPEHQDYYKNFTEYSQAKANLVRWQTKNDWLVYDADNSNTVDLVQTSPAHKISFSLTGKKTDLYLEKNSLCFQKSQITQIPQIPLLGHFNLKNVMAAVAVAKIFQVPDEKIIQAIKTFKSLPHRLELIGAFKNITFYNDSLATNPQATCEAIKALNEKSIIETLITGGYDRGGVDFNKLGKIIAQSNIKTVILFPPTGEKIWQAIKNSLADLSNFPDHFFVDNMKEAVKLAYEHTPKNSLCLLSCASASFGIFKDYADRGKQFKKFVKELGSK